MEQLSTVKVAKRGKVTIKELARMVLQLKKVKKQQNQQAKGKLKYPTSLGFKKTFKKKNFEDNWKIKGFECNEYGHKARLCPNKKNLENKDKEVLISVKNDGNKSKFKEMNKSNSKKQELKGITCFKCRKSGHTANECANARKSVTKENKSVGITSKKDSRVIFTPYLVNKVVTSAGHYVFIY